MPLTASDTRRIVCPLSSSSSNCNDLECHWRSFPYCNPFQVRYFIFVARCAVFLHQQSFL